MGKGDPTVLQETWGAAADGVQARLRALQGRWRAGEPVTLDFDLRNRGAGPHRGPRAAAACEVEVGGVWYRTNEPVDVKSFTLEPGAQVDGWTRPVLDGAWSPVAGGPPLRSFFRLAL